MDKVLIKEKADYKDKCLFVPVVKAKSTKQTFFNKGTKKILITCSKYSRDVG